MGRKAGLLDADMNLTREGMVPDEWIGLQTSTLFDRLEEMSSSLMRSFNEAAARGNKLRFMARVTKNNVSIGLTELSAQTAIGQLKGTDNIVVIHSKRYQERPLVVSGPGAGPAVTAMGVLGDILRIAAERA